MECKQKDSKMYGLFIFYISEQSNGKWTYTKLFYENIWQASGSIYYFNTCKLKKSMYDSERCTLFTAF